MTRPHRAERSHELDLLRGLACLAVVMFHLLHRGQLSGWISDEPPQWLSRLAAHGYLGVHLFFIISGYVIFMSVQGASARAFVVSRVARLCPAYWVAVLMTAGAAWLLASPVFAVGARELLVNLTMLTHLVWVGVEPPYVDGAYWSLAVEFQFYLIMLVLIATRQLARIEAVMAVWLLLSSADFVRRVYLAELLLALEWAPLFCAGILFYRIRCLGLTRQRYLMLWWCHLLTLARATDPSQLRPDSGGPEVWVIALLITAFFGLFWCVVARRWTVRGSALTIWVGALTYPVYLIHQNLSYMLLEVLRPFEPSLLLRLVLVLAGVLVLSVLVHCVIERPMGRWLRRRLEASASRVRHAPRPILARGPQPSR